MSQLILGLWINFKILNLKVTLYVLYLSWIHDSQKLIRFEQPVDFLYFNYEWLNLWWTLKITEKSQENKIDWNLFSRTSTCRYSMQVASAVFIKTMKRYSKQLIVLNCNFQSSNCSISMSSHYDDLCRSLRIPFARPILERLINQRKRVCMKKYVFNSVFNDCMLWPFIFFPLN